MLVVSPDILDELSRTLAKPYFTEHLTLGDITAFLDLLHTIAERVTVEGHVQDEERPIQVVLGREGAPGRTTTLVITSGSIDVYTSEVWTARDAADLFRAFAATGSLPTAVARRDISADIDGLQRHEPVLHPLTENIP